MTWHVAMKQSKLKPGKKKMRTVAKKLVLIGQIDDTYFATEALCRHMRWPLAYGAKVKDDCIRCPLHQTTHRIDTGEMVEWSPFPLSQHMGNLSVNSANKRFENLSDRVNNGSRSKIE